ncbi:hypothetical protein ACU4GD_02385 [Cupriavidus basilensis]
MGQTYMDVSNKTGTVPVTAQCGNEFSPPSPSYNCPNFWFSRTAASAASAASTLAGNPPAWVWAQAADNADASKVVKGAKYRIELFHGTNTTPTYSYNKTLLKRPHVPGHPRGEPAVEHAGQQVAGRAGPVQRQPGLVRRRPLTADWVRECLRPADRHGVAVSGRQQRHLEHIHASAQGRDLDRGQCGGAGASRPMPRAACCSGTGCWTTATKSAVYTYN